MRRAILPAAAVAIVACGGATAERLSGAETCDGIDVPTIGTVGDFPPPTGRLVVDVRADGTIVCEGRKVGFDALDARLAALDPGGERLSSTAVVLRIDGDLAWGATMQTIMNCATHRIDRVWSAAPPGCSASSTPTPAPGALPAVPRPGGLCLFFDICLSSGLRPV